MAKKTRKQPKPTNKQQYQTLEYAADFLGFVLRPLKRVTNKALKEAEKAYKNARKVLREAGMTEIPNRRQIEKLMREREKEAEQTPEQPFENEREPIEYAANEESAPKIDFAQRVIDDFQDATEDAFNEAVDMWSSRPDIISAITIIKERLDVTTQKLIDEIGAENLAQFIENSIEYDALKKVRQMGYGEVIDLFDNILLNLEAILNEAKSVLTNPQSRTNENI